MYSPIKLTLKYIRYYLTASNGRGFEIHSPFVFDFITKVLNNSKKFHSFHKIEHCRNIYLKDENELQIEDFGAGSRKKLFQNRRIKEIAKSSLKPKKYAQLLYRMVDYYQPKTIVELGTSLGITTAYLSSANSNAKIYTLEGSSEIAQTARKTFQFLQLENIELLEGEFQKTLPGLINSLNSVNFIFIDGNHRRTPTVEYFRLFLEKSTENTIFIFDDINWSEEMERAWGEIIHHPQVTTTIDLFFIGIVLLKKDFKSKQYFKIRF